MKLNKMKVDGQRTFAVSDSERATEGKCRAGVCLQDKSVTGTMVADLANLNRAFLRVPVSSSRASVPSIARCLPKLSVPTAANVARTIL